MAKSVNPACIMMVGIPCSGKSNHVEDMLTVLSCFNIDLPTIISIDTFIEKKAIELGLTYNDVFFDYAEQANAGYKEDLRNAARRGDDMIVDMTNTSVKSRRIKMDIVRQESKVDYDFSAIYVPITLTESLRRNPYRIGKFIPQHVIIGMHESFSMPTKDEGFSYIGTKPITVDRRKCFPYGGEHPRGNRTPKSMLTRAKPNSYTP